MTPKSINNAEHYTWGAACDGWHLLKSGSLSVIQETMPPGTSEQLHYHEKAQQLFYILEGIAHFEVDGNEVEVMANESLHILPMTKHRIFNRHYNRSLRFLVISEPKSHGDRINL